MLKIPDGWTAEPLTQDGFILIRNPDGLMVTLDYIKRGFRGGLVTTGRLHSDGRYTGRCWKQSLCDAAVQWLTEVTEGLGEEKLKPRRAGG